MLMPGNVSDTKAAPALLEHAVRMRYLLGDKGYDADQLRRLTREAGATPVIPGRRLKDFRRIHTRYDKLAANVASAVALAAIVAFWC